MTQRELVVELGRVVWLDAPRTGIQAEFHLPVTDANVRKLIGMRKWQVALKDYPRQGESRKIHDLGEFAGVIKAIKIPAKHDRPLTFVIDFDDNGVVQAALGWIRKCDPRNVLMVQTEMEIEDEDDAKKDAEADGQTEFGEDEDNE